MKKEKNKNDMTLRHFAWSERILVVTVIALCVLLIFHLASGEWLTSLTCCCWIYIAYEYSRQMRNLHLLMQYISILEAERKHLEKRISNLLEEIDESKGFVPSESDGE